MIQIIVVLIALMAPFVGYGIGRVQGEIEKKWAVSQETHKQLVACNMRVGEIETKLNRDVADAEERARVAASGVGDTPTVPAELQKLCDASPSCRSRGR